MWIENFINKQKLTEEIRKDLSGLGVKNPRAKKDLKDEVIAAMEFAGTMAIRRYLKNH